MKKSLILMFTLVMSAVTANAADTAGGGTVGSSEIISKELKPFNQLLGEYYLNATGSDTSNCPSSLNVKFEYDGVNVRLAGINIAMSVGFDPKLAQITNTPVITDAGSYGGRKTQFSFANKIYSTRDQYAGSGVNTLSLELIGNGFIGTEAKLSVKKEVPSTAEFSCSYFHRFFN